MRRKILVGNISILVLLTAFLGFVQMQGCGGGGGGAAPTGNLQVAITDSPAFQTFSSVHIKIDKVVVVPAGKEGVADNDPGLLTVATFPSGTDVDILKLHFLQQVLGTAPVPPGTYNQVRLILAPNPSTPPFNNYFILAGSSTQVALTTPSAQETGVKVNGRFTVTAGVLNTILLDFNPNEAIVQRGHSGQNNLKPTGIKIIQVFSSLANSASISGLIRSPVFKPLSSSTFKSWSSAVVSIAPRNPAAGAIASGVAFSSFSGSGVWKAPFTAFVPPTNSAFMSSANYKVFVQAFKDTQLQNAAFKLYSSPLMTANTAGVDFPVPPAGIVQLVP